MRDQVISTTDPEARHIHKTVSDYGAGFKAQVAFEPETGLFTAVAMTPGCGTEHHEAAVTPGLLADEDEPLAVLGDRHMAPQPARPDRPSPWPATRRSRAGFPVRQQQRHRAAGSPGACVPAYGGPALHRLRPEDP